MRRVLTVVSLCFACAGVGFAQASDRPGARLDRSQSSRLLERTNVNEAQLATADKYRSTIKAKASKNAEKNGAIPSAVPVARQTLKEDMSNSFVLGGGYNYQAVADMPVDHVQGAFVTGFYYPVSWIGFGGEYAYGRGSENDGNRQDKLTRHTGVVGPEFSGYPGDRVRVFFHPLFGYAKERLTTRTGNASTTSEETNFALQLGGGLDLRLSRSIAWRVFQFDYLGIKHPSTWQNNYRLVTGIAVRAH